MKIAVIGAAGFIGRHLLIHLDAHGHESSASDVAVPPPLASRVIICDIAHEPPTLPEHLDAVFYLAQFPGYRAFPENAGDLFGVNVAGALRAADAARAAGAKAFIYASTGTVYQPSFRPMTEGDPVRRDQPYALSKVHAEEALALIDTPRTCCVRLFGVFGHDQQTMLVPAIAARIARGDPVTLEPNPTDPADDGGLRIALTHVGDVCSVLVALAVRIVEGQPVPPLLNVANPRAVSIRHLATGIARRLGRDPVFETAKNPRASDYIADTTRLEGTIPHQFLSLDAALDRTFPTHA